MILFVIYIHCCMIALAVVLYSCHRTHQDAYTTLAQTVKKHAQITQFLHEEIQDLKKHRSAFEEDILKKHEQLNHMVAHELELVQASLEGIRNVQIKALEEDVQKLFNKLADKKAARGT